MAVSLREFVRGLTQSGLLSAAEVSKFLESLPPERRPKDAQALARALVKANKLTKYQATAVYQGKTQGLVFGEYTVLEMIGAGGMGVVLKARHRRMNRVVAVKMLPAAALKDEEAVRRFYREVEVAARLMHPNIVTALDAREHHGTHYLVMEYVEGKDLGRIVQEHGPLPVEQAVDWILQAARGLEYAHSKGVVHRDIKPSNLLVDKTGTVKILDMGLARLRREEAGDTGVASTSRLTQAGQMMGTIDYMSPEQAEDTRKADHRTDVYSLGCSLYRLLTGKPLYSGDTMMKRLLSHRGAEIPSLLDARPDVPRALDEVFRKMVAKRPEDRQQSMAEVIAALEASTATKEPAAGPVVSQSLSDSALTSFLENLSQAGASEKRSRASSPPQSDAREPDAPKAAKRPTAASRRQSSTRVADDTIPSQADQETDRNLWKRLAPVARSRKLLAGVGFATAALVVVSLVYTLVRRDRVESPHPTFEEDRWEAGTPPLAVAPFDARKAKVHQQRWAKHLGLPVQTTDPTGMVLVLVPPGEFDMGSAQSEIDQLLKKATEQGRSAMDLILGEGPRHRVRITKPFYLGKHEVTVGQFRRFVEETGYQTECEKDGRGGRVWNAATRRSQYGPQYNWRNPGFGQTDEHPVLEVTFNDAAAFCQWLGNLTQQTYRLPTEAEWEYACRAGTTGHYSFTGGEAKLGRHAWFADNSASRSHPVGRKAPNPWGLHDMYGNAWEWCRDFYEATYYKHSPPADPQGPSFGFTRVIRGGGCEQWAHAGRCRSALRYPYAPDTSLDHLGFRVVREIRSLSEGGEKDSGATGAADEPPSGPLEVGRRLPPPTPVAFEIPPEPLSLAQGAALARTALVTNPAPIKGLHSWTLETRSHRGAVSALAYRPDGRLLATAGDDGAIRLWDAAADDLIQALIAGGHALASLSWSPDGRFLAAGTTGGKIQLWEPQTGLLLRTLGGHIGQVDSVAFSPLGRILASGGADGAIRLWDVSAAEVSQVLDGHVAGVLALAWSPDGKTLASGGSVDGRVRLWDAESGHLQHEYLARRQVTPMPDISTEPGGQHVVEIADLVWSRDGKMLWPAAGCQFGWSVDSPLLDAASAEPLRTILRPHQGLSRLAWSPDGRILVGVRKRTTGGPQAYAWDAETGTQREGRWMPPELRKITAIAFSPDGSALVTAGTSGMVCLWRPPPQFNQLRLEEPTRILSQAGVKAQQHQQAEVSGTEVSFPDNRRADLSSDGHLRADPEVVEEFVYVVQTDQGQRTFTSDEFAAKYGWENTPQ